MILILCLSHREHRDVGEEGGSDDQQHHRPGKPESQVPKVKPSQPEWRQVQWRVKTQTWKVNISERAEINCKITKTWLLHHQLTI